MSNNFEHTDMSSSSDEEHFVEKKMKKPLSTNNTTNIKTDGEKPAVKRKYVRKNPTKRSTKPSVHEVSVNNVWDLIDKSYSTGSMVVVFIPTKSVVNN